jgi:purine-binding chemotaxis protein CheW
MNEDLLVVVVAEQQYALRVRRVREVVPRATLTALPGAPAGVLGILSLRGALLPILDLRHRLGLPAVAPRISQCIVVTQAERFTVGLLVDAVGDIVSEGAAPVLSGRRLPGALIEYVTELDGQVVSILDPDATVGAELAAFLSTILPESAALPGGADRQLVPQVVEP